MTPASLLCLLRLASPALPVGCYAYSQGLEWAVGSGAVQDEDGLERWLAGILRHCLATLDLPLLARLHRAWKQGDRDEAWRLDREVLAWRDSREARLEETQTGNALAKVLADSGVEAAQASRGRATYLGMFALACAAWGIPERECLLAFAWSFAENQTLAGGEAHPAGADGWTAHPGQDRPAHPGLRAGRPGRRLRPAALVRLRPFPGPAAP